MKVITTQRLFFKYIIFYFLLNEYVDYNIHVIIERVLKSHILLIFSYSLCTQDNLSSGHRILF